MKIFTINRPRQQQTVDVEHEDLSVNAGEQSSLVEVTELEVDDMGRLTLCNLLYVVKHINS